MLTIKSPREPIWVTVTAEGIDPPARLQLRPFSSLVLRAAARAIADAIEKGERTEDQADLFGLYLPAVAALAWEGVGDEAGAELEITREGVVALLEQNPTAYSAVDLAYVNPALLEEAEKNGSSPSPDGTSPAGATKPKKTPARRSRGVGGTTAQGAPALAPPAPTA